MIEELSPKRVALAPLSSESRQQRSELQASSNMRGAPAKAVAN
jgi:hypothetical protein